MDTRQKLEAALKDAMRAGDDMHKQNIRLVMSAIKLSEVGKGAPLDESGVIAMVQKEVKARHETILDAHKANRADLSERAEAEIQFLETFLPAQMTQEELAVLAAQSATEIGIDPATASPADMGKLMKALMPKVQGRAAGDQVSQAVRKLLQK